MRAGVLAGTCGAVCEDEKTVGLQRKPSLLSLSLLLLLLPSLLSLASLTVGGCDAAAVFCALCAA